MGFFLSNAAYMANDSDRETPGPEVGYRTLLGAVFGIVVNFYHAPVLLSAHQEPGTASLRIGS
ncbi:hypothetical protein GSI_08634 [Ganoderma sinense ZZ0214-1]|uniref:Uncharacterized protein n=1 Tax=Ganoderma sinense ZZ0214-1 TaxID=1077348 RepID=A0A2G8S485_9APHY|nr:hypothetical protein GSI_08634 [Ganoderma sinense ZZ0214-1]